MSTTCRAPAALPAAAAAPVRSACSVSGRGAGRLVAALAGGPAVAGRAAAPRRRQCGVQPRAQQAGAAHPPPAATFPNPPTLLWYKRDLRLDDHPGWHQALAAAPETSGAVVPVFCFDPARYAALVLPAGGAEALCKALASLNSSLRQRGSALAVRVGPWEEQLPALAAELGAGSILAEQEVEADWCQGVAGVAAALGPDVSLRQWQAPLCASHADDFRELQQQLPAFLAPLEAPASLPPLSAAAAVATGADDGASSSGLGLSARQLRQLALDAYTSTLHPQLLPAATAALGLGSTGATSSSLSFSDEDIHGVRLMDRLPEPASSTRTSSSGSGRGGSWEAELAAEIAAGEGPVLQALSSYFRHLETDAEGGSEGNAPELAAAISAADLPATPDGCFPALFGRALSLGVVSKRRIYAEAAAALQQQPEQARPAGLNPLAHLAWLLTSSGGAAAAQRRQRKASAAAAAAEARDFHEQMAVAREGRRAHGATLHHWRWKGVLTDYLAAPASGSGTAAAGAAERPAILLCHGFGAFSEHYRDNVAALAAQGFDVYAPTLPGYGRSEKPVLPYGQDLWRDFLADFVLQVVRRPVVAAGNSIGGFITASLAADYPGLVEGLVLLNSAGQLVEGYQLPATPPANSPPPAFVVDGVSRALFSYLEGGVTKQLRRVYPVNPQRADAWLGGEIARAARDPGALGVFRSVFYLPKPRALNYLVGQCFAKPTLVLQGKHDPLNDAKARAGDLGRLCGNAEVVLLEAGHCPHDEVPDLVNRHIITFVQQRVLPNMAAAASGGSSVEAAEGQQRRA